MNVSNRINYKPMGYQALVPTASTALTVPAGAKFALITTEVFDCRITDDGTTPTLTVGLLLKVGDPPFWYAGNLHSILLFNDTAGALVKVLYYS